MITELITGTATVVLGAYLWETKIRDRVTVRRIKSAKDKDVEGLIELYTSLFPDNGVNYSADDVMEFVQTDSISWKKRPVRVEDITLVARFRNIVVGFLLCHFYPDRNKAIISYYGIDKKFVEARKSAAISLLKKIADILKRKRECDFLFFDVERPSTKISKKENTEREARVTLFKQKAITLGLHAHKLQFDYHPPKITLAKGTHEDSLILMFVPLNLLNVSSLTKVEVAEFLRFVYLDCYGDIYHIDDPRFVKYHEHLITKLNKCEKSLPAKIPLA